MDCRVKPGNDGGEAGREAASRLQRGGDEVPEQLDVQLITISAVTAASAVNQRGAISAPILPLSDGEHDQRHDGEGQLQAQDHLAEDQELRGALRRRTRW